MYSMLSRCGAMALFFCAAGSLAQDLPIPFEAKYTGSKFPLSADVTISLSRMGGYYRYTLRGVVRAAFFKWTDVYDCSVMRIRGDEFFPLEYVHRDSRDSRHNVHTRFDWTNRSARTTRGDGTVLEIKELPPIAWDLMSIQVRLRADAARTNHAADLSYDIVEKDSVKRRNVKFSGVQDFQSDDQWLKIVKVEADDDKRRNAFWFAKNYAWLPVRVGMGGVTLDLVSSPGEAGRDATPAVDQPPSCQ